MNDLTGKNPAVTAKTAGMNQSRAAAQFERGNVYMADLSPVVGSEQGGCRPVVVIQNNVGNRNSSTVVVAPLTTARKTKLPTHVPLIFNGRSNLILLEAIRTISKDRLGTWVGCIGPRVMKNLDKALRTSLGLDDKYNNVTNRVPPDDANGERRPVERGEVYMADLSPVVGNEQGGYRPVVVIQNNVGNLYSPTVIIAPLTTAHKAPLPTHVETKVNGKGSTILLDAVRTISKQRLVSQMGSISKKTIRKVNHALAVSMALPGIQ